MKTIEFTESYRQNEILKTKEFNCVDFGEGIYELSFKIFIYCFFINIHKVEEGDDTFYEIQNAIALNMLEGDKTGARVDISKDSRLYGLIDDFMRTNYG